MPAFLFRLIPPRPDFPLTMDDEERSVMVDHVAYWTRLTGQGRVAAFGPVEDPAGTYGIGIIVADDLPGAERLRDDDPAVRSSLGFHTEILPMAALVTPTGPIDGA